MNNKHEAKRNIVKKQLRDFGISSSLEGEDLDVFVELVYHIMWGSDFPSKETRIQVYQLDYIREWADRFKTKREYQCLHPAYQRVIKKRWPLRYATELDVLDAVCEGSDGN